GDGGGGGAGGARENGNERRQEQFVADHEAVRNRLRQRERRPEVVQARGEDRDAPRAVAVELVVEPVRDALEVRLQRAALLVREVLAVDLLGAVQQRGHPRVRVAGGRNLG